MNHDESICFSLVFSSLRFSGDETFSLRGYISDQGEVPSASPGISGWISSTTYNGTRLSEMFVDVSTKQ